MNKRPNILCNFCGLSCILESEPHNYGGLINCSVQGGYDSTPGNGSGALDDFDRYTFSLCEFCLDWLFCQFKIPVTVTNSGEIETFQPAKERVLNNDWRRFKNEFFAEFEKRNHARNERLN